MFLRNTAGIITGGARGLGKGFARAVIEAGCKVALLDVNEAVGHATAAEFNSKFGSNSALFIKCDIRNEKEVDAAFKEAYDKFGRIDLLVNNAGVSSYGVQGWQRTIDINLTGAMRCCFVASDYMIRDRRGGYIVNIASAAGIYSVPYDPAYVASKHGVVGMSRSFSEALESHSIRVGCLCPAYANTDLVRDAVALEEKLQQDGEKLFTNSLKLLGVMEIDDVVNAFKQLLSAPDLTGGVLYVGKNGTKYIHKPRKITSSSKL